MSKFNNLRLYSINRLSRNTKFVALYKKFIFSYIQKRSVLKELSRFFRNFSFDKIGLIYIKFRRSLREDLENIYFFQKIFFFD